MFSIVQAKPFDAAITSTIREEYLDIPVRK